MASIKYLFPLLLPFMGLHVRSDLVKNENRETPKEKKVCAYVLINECDTQRFVPQQVKYFHDNNKNILQDKTWSEGQSEVLHLTANDFKQALRNKKHVLVVFYSPWCKYCENMKTEFYKAANEFKNDPNVEFAAVDCTKEKTLCDENGVKGYPTLRYYSYYNNTSYYKGNRTEQDFVMYMKEQMKNN